MGRESSIKQQYWIIYLLLLDNFGKKTRHYGHTKEYYTGITTNFGKRLGDHLFGRGYGYTNRYWKNARKKPVYAEWFFGSELDAMAREKKIKVFKVEKKESLINSESNMLVGYKPLKHVILWDYEMKNQVIMKII